MSKDKKNNTQLFDTPTPDSVEVNPEKPDTTATVMEAEIETPTPEAEGIEVSIEYEVNPAEPKPTEQVVMEAKIEVKKPEPVSPQIKILNEFAEIMKKYGKHGLVDYTIGEQIWKLWQDYTGRTDKWRRCSSCLVPKCMRLIKECKVHNISIV